MNRSWIKMKWTPKTNAPVFLYFINVTAMKVTCILTLTSCRLFDKILWNDRSNHIVEAGISNEDYQSINYETSYYIKK